METKPFSLQSPEQIAKDYGGNKQKIAQAAQMGMLDPTAAVLAGMFIDRMRGAQMEEQGAPQTVAEDVFMPQQPQMGMGAVPGMGGMPPEMGMAPPMQQPMPQAMGAPAQAGLDTLPVPNEMFAGPGMASGGLVAFARAGEVDRDKALREQQARDAERLRKAVGYSGVADLATFIPRAGMGIGNVGIRALRAAGLDIPYMPYGMYTGTGMDYAPFSRNILDRAEAEKAEAGTAEPDEVEAKAETEPGTPTRRGKTMDDAVPLGRNEVVAELPSPEAVKAEESALDQYTRMLLEGMQDRDVSREEAKNMALLQAGLGIMGGTSPYALQNIAQGALPATQAYQQQMAQQRKEERETIGELANIEVKARELGLTEQRYKDLMRIAEMQVAATAGRGDATSERALTTARINLAKEIMRNEAMGVEKAWDLSGKLIGIAVEGGGTGTIDFNEFQGKEPGFFGRLFGRSGN